MEAVSFFASTIFSRRFSASASSSSKCLVSRWISSSLARRALWYIRASVMGRPSSALWWYSLSQSRYSRQRSSSSASWTCTWAMASAYSPWRTPSTCCL